MMSGGWLLSVPGVQEEANPVGGGGRMRTKVRKQGKARAGAPDKPPSKPRIARRPARQVESASRKSRPNSSSSAVAAGFPIVGVGASAGGLEAFTELLKHVPLDTGMGFVLVQHLDPAHVSALTQLLSRATSLPVREVTNELRVQRNQVYVIPPNTHLSIARGVLKLQPRKAGAGAQRSVDFFFDSLAQDQHERAVGVILSGTASDGTLGLEAIKAEGGITFAQDKSAKYDSMPRSAIASGCVDFVLSPEHIAKELGRIARHPYVAKDSVEDGAGRLRDPGAYRGARTSRSPGARSGRMVSASRHEFEGILTRLCNRCGVDFSLYKSSTIQRRINRRMVLNKLTTLKEYARFLRGNAGELDALYSDMLISVTSFFRNPEAFDVLWRKVFPGLIAERRKELLRIWVLGCSTGQEAYSLAMACSEFADRVPGAPKLQLFATDVQAIRADPRFRLVDDFGDGRLLLFEVVGSGAPSG